MRKTDITHGQVFYNNKIYNWARDRKTAILTVYYLNKVVLTHKDSPQKITSDFIKQLLEHYNNSGRSIIYD